MSSAKHRLRWRRLLDGERSWGGLDVYPAYHGVARYRLVVFPPGLSPEERLLLRLARSWKVWGIVIWAALATILVPTMGSAQALAVSTGTWLATGAAVMATAGVNRVRVRTLSVVRMAGIDDGVALEKLDTLRGLVDDLTVADRMLAGGEFSAVEHEAVVWRVYDLLSAPAVKAP